MTAPERGPRPGVTWETELVRFGEAVVEGDDGEPFSWDDTGTSGPDGNMPGTGRPNRATRRAQARTARRKGQR